MIEDLKKKLKKLSVENIEKDLKLTELAIEEFRHDRRMRRTALRLAKRRKLQYIG